MITRRCSKTVAFVATLTNGAFEIGSPPTLELRPVLGTPRGGVGRVGGPGAPSQGLFAAFIGRLTGRGAADRGDKGRGGARGRDRPARDAADRRKCSDEIAPSC